MICLVVLVAQRVSVIDADQFAFAQNFKHNIVVRGWHGAALFIADFNHNMCHIAPVCCERAVIGRKRYRRWFAGCRHFHRIGNLAVLGRDSFEGARLIRDVP